MGWQRFLTEQRNLERKAIRMNSETDRPRSLREMELAVEELAVEIEGSKPTATAEFSPQSGHKIHHRRQESMHLRTAFGLVGLKVWRGKDPADGHWGCPIRERGA